MYLPVLLFFSYISSMFFLVLSDNKKVYIYTISLSYISFLIMGCIYFFLLKYNGENLLTFPDEKLYVYDHDSKLLFSNYVQVISEILGVEFIRTFNIFIFSTTIGLLISCVFQRIRGRFIFSCLVVLVILTGSYWSFFILKESFTISAIAMIILSKLTNRKILLYLSLLILFLSRPDLCLLYLACGFLIKIRKKNKKIFYLVISISILFVFIFFNTQYSTPLKLFTLSRRFGEGSFEFDDIAVSTSSLGFISYIISEPLRQAILTNINSSFNIFYDFNILVSLHKILNIFVLLMLFRVLKIVRFWDDNLLFFLLVSLLGLIFTHSIYRYVNVLFIPMSFYIFYILYNVRECLNEKKESVCNRTFI